MSAPWPKRKIVRVSAALTKRGLRPSLFECGHFVNVFEGRIGEHVKCEQCVEKAIDPLRVEWGHVSFPDESRWAAYRQRDRREFFERLTFAARHAVEYPSTRAEREIKAWFMAAIVNATDEEKIALDAALGAPVGTQRAGGGA